MAAFHLPSKLKKFPLFSLKKLIQFSSSSRTNPRISNLNSKTPESEPKSLVYKQKLQFQRPPTIRRENLDWKNPQSGFNRLNNLVTFIGTVIYPLRIVNSQRYGLHTILKVDSEKRFRVMLKMWGEMAEISDKYLKENDFIYVSGRLGSYTKVGDDGHSKIFYEVTVDEFNYVACSHRSQHYQIYETPEASILTAGGLEKDKKTERDRERERLHLWQVFLVNPHEWWDNRKTKKNPRAPDFKHKDTGEVLWLDPKDPPWLKRQLQLHDSRMEERGYLDFGNTRSRVSMWKYDE